MVSFFVYRLWQIFVSQPTIPKKDGALKIGMLGAATIGPFAILTPAKQHPEVIVQAVAARDRKKATDYAKKHGIPQVFDSYQALLDDPTIDAVYIPLPNGLHYEWALKALARGKNVLLEKPSASNGEEAELLFRSPLLLQPRLQQGQKPPVLLEAFHYRFQPCWLLFMTLIDRPSIAHVYAHIRIASSIVGKDDIRFKYHLAGGALMDLTYTHHIIRTVLGTEPEECTSSATEACASPPGDATCDARYDTTWRFPGGVTAEAHGDLQSTLAKMLDSTARVVVQHRAVRVADDESGTSARTGQVKERIRRVEFENCIIGNIYHRITVEDEFVVREDGGGAEGRVVKRWKTKEVKKAYTMQDAGIDAPGETYWLSYRWQLEEFVNRIRGRPGSGAWVEADDSVAQMHMIDMAYAKAGLPLRPTSEYRPAEQAS